MQILCFPSFEMDAWSKSLNFGRCPPLSDQCVSQVSAAFAPTAPKMNGHYLGRLLAAAICSAVALSCVEAVCNPGLCTELPCSENVKSQCRNATGYVLLIPSDCENANSAGTKFLLIRCVPNYCGCTSSFFDDAGERVCFFQHLHPAECTSSILEQCPRLECPSAATYRPSGSCCRKCMLPFSAPRRAIGCRTVRCMRPSCPPGTELLESGLSCCPTCAPRMPCPTRKCNNVCIDGYARADNGCETCRCDTSRRERLSVPRKECPPVCAIYCDLGNVLDTNGCPTCRCRTEPLLGPKQLKPHNHR